MWAITDDHFPALLVLLSPEAETEKFDVGLGNVPHLRLLSVYHKKQLFFDEGFVLLGDVNNETIGHANLKNRSERTESLKRK